MELQPGTRWKSLVCETEVIVVRAPHGSVELGCGGAPMAARDESPDGEYLLDPALSEGTSIGKRYADPAESIELLCMKAGRGTLTLNGVVLSPRAPKNLPSSD